MKNMFFLYINEESINSYFYSPEVDKIVIKQVKTLFF